MFSWPPKSCDQQGWHNFLSSWLQLKLQTQTQTQTRTSHMDSDALALTHIWTPRHLNSTHDTHMTYTYTTSHVTCAVLHSSYHANIYIYTYTQNTHIHRFILLGIHEWCVFYWCTRDDKHELWWHWGMWHCEGCLKAVIHLNNIHMMECIADLWQQQWNVVGLFCIHKS